MMKLAYFPSADDYKSESPVPVDKNGYTPFNCQIQDMSIKVGRYWTNLTRRFNYIRVAEKLAGVNSAEDGVRRIDNLIASDRLSERARLDIDALKNIDDGLYALDFPQIVTSEFIDRTIMGLPFSSLELDKTTLDVLASPFFSDYASKSEQVGVSRYDLAKMGNPQINDYMEGRFGYKKTYERVNSMLTGEVHDFVLSVLERVNDSVSSENKLFTDESKRTLTEYGYYVVKLFGEDIAKYALMKSLLPNLTPIVNSKGQIIYDTDYTRENSSLSQLRVKGYTPKYEAELLADRMYQGLRKVSTDSADIEKAKNAVLNRINGLSINSFRYAEAIVKVAQQDPYYRIDAMKDVENIDSIRNNEDSAEKVLDNLKSYWKKFKDAIYEITPHINILGEITDNEFIGGSGGEAALIKESEISSVAGYSNSFTPLKRVLTGGSDRSSFAREMLQVFIVSHHCLEIL